MSDIKITEVPPAYSVSTDDEFYAKIGNVFRRVQISKLAEIIGTPQKFRIVIAYDPDDGYVSDKSYSQIAVSVENGEAIAPVLIPDQLSAEEYNGRLLYAENGEAIFAFIDASTADDPQILIATVTDENFMTGVDVVKFPAGHRGLVVPVPESSDGGKVLKAGLSGDASWEPESGGGSGGGWSNEAKELLLECFRQCAWVTPAGQTYLSALETELFPPASLVSISAVFAQGTTVIYDTDTLDILKPMLTVTATFDDASTAPVLIYELSGTLTEGTSTITVAYNEKTTTFNVTVTHKNVPSEFQEVTYIGATGTQYIMTDVVTTANDRPDYGFDIDFKFDSWQSANATNIVAGFSTAGGTWLGYLNGQEKIGMGTSSGNYFTTGTVTDRHSYSFVFSNGVGICTRDDNASVSREATFESGNKVFQLFNYNVGSPTPNFRFSGKIYSCTVYKNGDVYRKYIPCYRKSNGVIGMFESITGTFLTNNGTGTFTKGDDVA